MTNFLETIRQAFRALRANRLRAFLTLMIVSLGIMALVGILTAIDSILFSLGENFSTLGANSFSIQPRGMELGGQRHGRRLKKGQEITFAEAMAFKSQYDAPATVSLSIRGENMAEVQHLGKRTNPNVQIIGIDEGYLMVNGYDIQEGRNFTEHEIVNAYDRAIIGQDIVELLFNGNPAAAMDQSILVSNRRYRIIGVLKSKGSSINQAGDRVVLVPIQKVRESIGASNVNVNLGVAVTQSAYMDDAIDAAIGLFRGIRGLKLQEKDDFEIAKSDGLISIIKENTIQLRLAAIGIGIITLLGAAIGLMNIMLVAVAERTREIGVIKALGARNRDVMRQFLTEAVIICQLGGLLGILLGIGAGNAVALVVKGPFVMPWGWIILGIITCTIVGLVAGVYPAAKASKLDPIESLRYE